MPGIPSEQGWAFRLDLGTTFQTGEPQLAGECRSLEGEQVLVEGVDSDGDIEGDNLVSFDEGGGRYRRQV